jgi:DNA-binding FadR family transcriptional regulator
MANKKFNFYTCMTDGSLDWTPEERAASDAKVAENHRRIKEACERFDREKAERIRRAKNS